MVKCVVSGCPSRTSSLFNRAPKTFFSFPTDPIRVKVWLAALRETDKLDSKKQHLICEDHFLKEDITSNGVKSDAIPIMSPYLDGSIGTDSSWEAERHEEENVCVVSIGDDPAPTEPPEPDSSPIISSPTKDPDPGETPETEDTGSTQQMIEIGNTRPDSGVSLPLRFLRLLQTLPGVAVECSQLVKMLQADQRRISEICSILEGINLVERQRNMIKWIGGTDHCPPPALQSLQSEMENLELIEEELDRLIGDVFQQLLEISNDKQNAELAYVTLDDIRRLEAFEEQTVMVVKAPDETVLKVPEPSEDFIQIHVRSWNGPVTVLTFDIGTEDTTAERNACFSSLEESRMKTSALHGEVVSSSCPVSMSDVTSSEDTLTS